MKRAKDDEKLMEPMFPRLHVNDKDKGGPRAPPRNKMALYEQLSVPSQRFNPCVLPLNPSNTSNLVPSGYSIQGGSHKRHLLFPVHSHPSVATNMAKNFHPCQIDGSNLNTPSSQLEQMKRVGDKDDFRVPVFVKTGMDQYNNKTHNSYDREKPATFTTSYSSSSVKLQNAGVKNPKGVNLTVPCSRQELKNKSDQNSEACISSRDHLVKSATNLPNREKADGNVYEVNLTPNQEYQDHLSANFGRYVSNGDCLVGESRVVLQQRDGADEVIESARCLEHTNVSQPRSNFHLREDSSHSSEPNKNGKSHGEETCRLPLLTNGDKSDDTSETSMVDSMFGLDIFPDDVVGIIGQKHFWKARRAIVDQQRVFAVQVFELHRLIKVQRLIAASPEFLSDGTYLGKPSMKSCLAPRLPIEYVATPSPRGQSKDDIEKPNHEMECSAENAVGKISVSPGKIGSQPLNFGLPQPLAPVATNTKTAPSCFHASPVHQWLLPVMSPSEGLVYKPYPEPGFTGIGCGGRGPTPFSSFSFPMAYNHHQGFRFLAGIPTVGQNFFPPYDITFNNTAISSSSVERTNWFVGPGLHGQTSHLSNRGASFNTEHQSSCSVPTQKTGILPEATKFRSFWESEIHGSTTNSPVEKGDGTAQRNGALFLFPTAPAADDRASQLHHTDQLRRVIKVVPRNPRSASETVARIFQSIQEERKHHEINLKRLPITGT